MIRTLEPPPGRLILSTVSSSVDALAEALEKLERRFGRVQFETDAIPCSDAERFREEMGDRPQRRFFSFERMVARCSLIDVKAACDKIEPQFADEVDGFMFRTVNLNPGIMSEENLIMAGHRELNHCVYIGQGTYAEIALIYTRGQFVRLPWTNPDFYSDQAIDLFNRVRDCFEIMEQV